MASCLITLAGTSGTIRINYTQDSVQNVITTAYGVAPIYIDDTATDITYTTLSGDVTASSGCVTITELPITCYKFTYDRLRGDTTEYDSKFDAVVIGSTVYDITDVSDKSAYLGDLIQAINVTLDNDDIKIVAMYGVNLTDDYQRIDLIMKVVGSDIPMLRIKSPNNSYSFLIGTVSVDCIPTDFIALPSCEIAPLP